MQRQLTALATAFCLLFGLAASGGAAPPRLVCRFTGRPMPPVVVPAIAKHPGRAAKPTAREHSCCAVTPAVTKAAVPDAVPRAGWALVQPGCCKLLDAPERTAPPATFAAAASRSLALAWAPALPRAVAPSAVSVAWAAPVLRVRPPRAPPSPHAAAPRAPPVFS